MSPIKEEPFKLVRNLVTVETDIAISTGEGLQNIWEYKVPEGETLILRKKDTFSVYLENSSSAECGAGSLVDIVVTDANKQNLRQLLNIVRYTQLKEFADRDKMCHVDVKEGEDFKVEEGERVIIRGNVNTTLDADDSYFELTCGKARRTLLRK